MPGVLWVSGSGGGFWVSLAFWVFGVFGCLGCLGVWVFGCLGVWVLSGLPLIRFFITLESLGVHPAPSRLGAYNTN